MANKVGSRSSSHGEQKKLLQEEGPSDGRVTLRLVLSCIVSLFGSFQFGWHTGVVNLIEKIVKSNLALTKTEWGVAVGIFAVGGLMGAWAVPKLADKLGRKHTLTLNSLNFVITGLLQFVSGAIQDQHRAAYAVLIISRITAGIGCGGATVAVPMYLGEVASKNRRGLFGGLNQFATVLGIFLSQAISVGMNTSELWKWLLSISGFLGLVQVVLGFVLLESPKWFVTRGRFQEAKKTLLAFRDYSDDDADAELDEIMLSAGKSAEKEEPSFYSIMVDKSLRKPLVAAIILTVSQQLSGINAVFYYSGTFFDKVGTSAKLGTLLSSAVNLAAMGVGVQLMERLGRRMLLLTGAMGMCISALSIVITMGIRKDVDSGRDALGYIIIVFILSFVTFFEIGLGAIPWQIGGEIFPDGPRATAMSAAAMCNWVSNGIIGVIFPSMVNNMEEFTFLPFVIILFGAWFFTYRTVPETKGRTVAEILEAFHGRAPLTYKGPIVPTVGDPTSVNRNAQNHSESQDYGGSYNSREPEP
eukprot:gb/GECG01012938.1/.p1 GENE.gb/GECG01012938.1/~~gb/GECG01012938.1/.p1  ORF type:complete len:528 (+),score=47.23 gb/GECG01012938.1/:1-1584(+)